MIVDVTDITMASLRRYFTEEEVIALVESGWDSDAGSHAGGISSDEEFELNVQLGLDNDFTW